MTNYVGETLETTSRRFEVFARLLFRREMLVFAAPRALARDRVEAFRLVLALPERRRDVGLVAIGRTLIPCPRLACVSARELGEANRPVAVIRLATAAVGMVATNSSIRRASVAVIGNVFAARSKGRWRSEDLSTLKGFARLRFPPMGQMLHPSSGRGTARKCWGPLRGTGDDPPFTARRLLQGCAR